MKPAVVLIDLQNDFLDAPGLQPSRSAVISGAAALLLRARSASIPVFHVRTSISDARPAMPHWTRPRCVEGTHGHEVPGELRPRDEERVIDKSYFSAFEGGVLERELRAAGADTVILAGVQLHACVRETAFEAYARGFGVVIAEDAVGSDDPMHGAASRRYMEERFASFRSTDEVLHGTADLAPAAIDLTACVEAGRAWRSLAPRDRAAVIVALADQLSSRAGLLAREITDGIRKPIRFSGGEVERTAALLRAAAAEAVNEQRSGRGRRVPRGVVAIITPWNNPIAIPLGKIAPALAFGNAVAWKPSPLAAALTNRLRELLLAAGVPPPLVTIVEGGDQAARALLRHPAVDAATITGSNRAGMAAADLCARRNVPLQAELGGNNAAVVWSDVDPGRAAARLAEGAFAFAGQRCTANRRVIVADGIRDAFMRELRRAAAALPAGDPADPRTVIGPVVNARAAGRITSIIARAKSRWPVWQPGLPGGVPDDFVAPTIVECDDPGDDIVQEETFGPLVVVQRARDFDHALALCNGVRHGLAAALFSPSAALQRRFLEEAEAGILKLNETTADADAVSPFGGWKASGIGPPEHGAANREFYTRWQSVYGREEE